jgi:8-amino-7-oxononanoate synthase
VNAAVKSFTPSPSRGGLAADWAAEELALLEAKGLLRQLEPLESAQGAVVKIGGRSLINFSSNDYLGLAGDADLADAVQGALVHFGVGSGASRLIVGDSLAHRALESAAAEWLGCEASVLFNSGYAANVGVLSTLLGEGDVIFSDALNHASLIDGCRLSKARAVIYPHRDVAALATLLDANPGRRRLVVTDSVFSMDGDVAPLRELSALCASRGVGLYVDEAHALGLYGAEGAGLCDALGVVPDLRLGTLGKAVGAFGAFVAGSREACALMVNRARSLVFSTSLPAMVCAAATASIERIRSDAALRKKAWGNIEAFSAGLNTLGHSARPDSAIFSVILGAPEAALRASAFLRERGVLAKAIRPPTVPEGTSRMRFAISAAHADQHLEAALVALAALKNTPRSP